MSTTKSRYAQRMKRMGCSVKGEEWSTSLRSNRKLLLRAALPALV